MLTPSESLSRWYEQHPPRLAFTGTSPEEFRDWRSRLFGAVRESSGLSKMDAWASDGATRADDPVEAGDHLRQRVLLQTAPDYWMPFYVLKPAGAGTFIPLIALHGHGRGKDDVAGIAGDEKDRQRIREQRLDYGLAAVRQGYIVFVPDRRGFGERGGPGQRCSDLATPAILLGMSVIGLHTRDNQRLLDHIAARPDCRRGSVGCIGLSGGGGGALWLAAVDERIGAAVVSGHLAAYESGKFGCVCNVAPGLLELCDRGDLAGLIAPRPLLVESGAQDPFFSRARALEAFETLRRIYRAAGAPERLEMDAFEGAHHWSGQKAWPFLRRWLAHCP